MTDPGCFYGILDVHAKVNEIDHQLDVALGLHIRLHYPKGHKGLLPLKQHSRDDGMGKPFMGLQPIEMVPAGRGQKIGLCRP